MADAIDKIEWLKSHDELAQRIALNGRNFGKWCKLYYILLTYNDIDNDDDSYYNNDYNVDDSDDVDDDNL